MPIVKASTIWGGAPVRLEEYLIRLGEIWCGAVDLKETTLGARLANDGKLFDRLRSGGGVTTGRFQDFLQFFRDGANWPAGRIPAEAGSLLDNFENIAVEVAASTGLPGAASREVAERAA
ncbi:MAG: hypothetical protein ACK4PC_03525 [Sphingopyxis sp.]